MNPTWAGVFVAGVAGVGLGYWLKGYMELKGKQQALTAPRPGGTAPRPGGQVMPPQYAGALR